MQTWRKEGGGRRKSAEKGQKKVREKEERSDSKYDTLPSGEIDLPE